MLRVDSAVATTTITTTPKKILGTTTLINEFRFSANEVSNRLQYTGIQTRTFLITSSISFTGSTNNIIYTFTIYKNGTTALSQSSASIKLTQATDGTTLSLNGAISLEQNDYIELFVSGASGTTTITANKMTISIT